MKIPSAIMRIHPPGSSAAAILLLVAVLVLAPASWAQDESQSPEGADSEVQRHQDWAVECRPAPESEAELCVMFQRQVLEDGRTLLLMTVRRTTEHPEPVAILQLPLGVLLQPGVSISVDGGEPRELSYTLCNNDGCIAVFPLDGGMKEALKQGMTAEVLVVTADNREVTVDVSLSGFSAALDAL